MKRVVFAGGAGVNIALCERLDSAFKKRGIRVHYLELSLCTDNGTAIAMIAMAAAMRLQSGIRTVNTAY